MPKFYVATGENKTTNLEKVIARGSLDDLKGAIRENPPGILWEVDVFDFNFTKETICAFAEHTQEPAERIKLRLNDKGQVRVIE